MNAVTEYPRARAFWRLSRALANFYSNPIEYERQLNSYIQLFFALGRAQGFAVASQTMSEIADHYKDRYLRPGLWSGLRNARVRASRCKASSAAACNEPISGPSGGKGGGS